MSSLVRIATKEANQEGCCQMFFAWFKALNDLFQSEKDWGAKKGIKKKQPAENYM